MTMPSVKFCGITRVQDAELAVSLGAWAVGMILWPGSPRAVTVDQAIGLRAAVGRGAEAVGVFHNQTLQEVAAVADAAGLTILQMHGQEGPVFCAEAARRTGCRVIKAARIQTGADIHALAPFHTNFHLLDSHVPGIPGGTGETFEWVSRPGLPAADPAPAWRRAGPADPQRRPAPRERQRRDRGGRPVRGRRRERRRERARNQGSRVDAGVRRGGRRQLRAHSPKPGVSTAVEHRFGPYGGQYVPETLMPALAELEREWVRAWEDPDFRERLSSLLRDYVGRPSPLYHARRLSKYGGPPRLPQARRPQPHRRP